MLSSLTGLDYYGNAARRRDGSRMAQITVVCSSRKRSSLLFDDRRASAHHCCLLFAQALITVL
jgi:hypothetical protein